MSSPEFKSNRMNGIVAFTAFALSWENFLNKKKKYSPAENRAQWLG